MTDPANNTVAYVLKRFPVLSETFVLNEILALEARGVPIHIFSLERPNDPRFHEDLARLNAMISFVPDVSKIDSLWNHRRRVSSRYRQNYRRARTYAMRRPNPSLFWRFLQACYLASEAKRLRIGHFHAHFATRPTTVSFMASMITGLPYSFTAHAMDIFKTQLSPKALKKKIEHARFVVTVSDFNKEFLENIADGLPSRVERIYNGIDLERFQPGTSPPRSPFTFLCVARFVEKKGHEVLIEACRRLEKKGIEFECWLVGKGKLRSSFVDLVKKHGLLERVRFLGAKKQGELTDIFPQASALVLPCRIAADGNRDGLPVSIVEALACGLPVITTPMTGIPEVVRDGHNGILVPPDDARALAKAMERMVSNADRWSRLKSNARASVESQFDLKRNSAELHRLFSESMS